MLHAIFTIARARFLVARNTFWRGKIGRKIAWIVFTAFLLFVAYGIYWLMSNAVRAFNSPEFVRVLQQAAARSPELVTITDVRPYLVSLPSIALFFALLMLVLTSFSTVLSSLYLSGDIDMLLVAPVPMRAVFVVKFFGGLLIPYMLMFVLLGPALIGFGTGMEYGISYYFAAVLALVLLPLLPFSLGALLVMAVVRVIPARRAREIVGVIGGLVGISWYVLSQFSGRFSRQVANVATLGVLERLNNPLLPSAWAGRALVSAGEGEWATFAAFGGLFMLVSVGAFAGALLLGERVYYDGWSNMAVQGGKVKSKPRQSVDRRSPLLNGVFGLLPRTSAAILYKDLRVFPRDLRNVQQLIFPLVMAGVWTFNLFAGGPGGNRSIDIGPATSAVNLLVPAGISAFICLSFSSALGGPNISREGKGFWQLKIAPISSWQLLLGKFILAYAPYPVIGTLFITLISLIQGSRLQDALAAWAIVVITGIGVCAITLGMGAAFPKFDWNKPSDQNSLQSGCLSPLFYFTYLALALGAMVGMPLLGTLVPNWALAITVLGWLLAIGLTIGVAWGFLSFGARRLEAVEV